MKTRTLVAYIQGRRDNYYTTGELTVTTDERAQLTRELTVFLI